MVDRTSRVGVVVDVNSRGASAGLKGFIGLAGGAALGVGALAVGGAVAANKLYGFADAVDDANASIGQGIETMGLFGNRSDEVTQRVLDQAKAVSQATAIDQTSIKTTQAKLLTFGELAKSADKMGGNFDRATMAALDMAAKGFGSAESNATQLGKAMNDPVKGITALTRAGVTFTETEKAKIAAMVESGNVMGAQSFILTAIEKQVGGTAEATAGGFEKMKNSVKLWAEEMAMKALPYMDAFGDFMITKGGPAILGFARGVADVAVPALRSMAGFVQDKVIPGARDLAGWINDHLVPAYKTVLSGALEGARGLFKNVADAVDDNRGEMSDLGEAAKKAAEFFVDKVIPVMGDVYKNVLPALGEGIGIAIDQISGMVTAFQNVYDKVSSVIGIVQNLIDKIESIPGGGSLTGLLGAVTRTSTGSGGAPTLDLDGTKGSLVGARTLSLAPAAAPQIHLHFPGGYFVGDEAKLVREIQQMFRNNGVRFNGLELAS